MSRDALLFVIASSLVFLGAMTSIGWIFRIKAIVQFVPGGSGMRLASALCLAAIGIVFLLFRIRRRTVSYITTAITYVVTLWSSAMLFEHLSGVNLGVDLPGLEAWLPEAGLSNGRMAINSAFGFAMAGGAMLLLRHTRNGTSGALLGVLVFGVFAVGVMGVASFLFHIQFIYNWYGYSSMALTTAVGMILTAVALLLLFRDMAWYRAWTVASPDEHIAAVGAAWLAGVALAAGIAGFLAMWERAEENLSDGLTIALVNRTLLFESIIRLRIDNVSYVVSRPQLARQTRILVQSPGNEEARALIAGIADSFVGAGFSGIAIEDLQGRLIASSGFFEPKPELRVSIKGRYDSELLWKDQLILHVRSRYSDDAGFLGTVVTEQTLPILTRSMFDSTGIGETGDGGLCGLRGDVLDCFPQRLRNTTLVTPKMRNGSLIPIARAISGERGVTRIVDYRGQEAVSAFAPVGDLGLGMSLKMDAAEIYAPVRDRLQVFAPLLLVVVVVGTLVLRLQMKPLVSALLETQRTLRREVIARDNAEEDLRASNAKLENAMFAKDRFLASMSHELRTPLNAVIGFTGTLLMRLPGPLTADQERQLKIVQSSARHQLALINDLLNIAQIESGKVKLVLEAIDCTTVVDEVLATVRLQAEAKALELRRVFPAFLRPVKADRRALVQILFNLVANAIKFTERGRVSVTVEEREEDGTWFMDLSVADTGVGIRVEDQGRLFGAFEQVGGERERGTGLGLHLSRRLAELQGGRITYTSEFGAGSTFVLTLGLAVADV